MNQNQYEIHGLENATLPFIFHRIYTMSSHRIPPINWHENIEILFGRQGHASLKDNRDMFPFSAGEFAVLSANHLHAVCTGEEAYTYDCLIIDRSFGRQNGIDTSSLMFDHVFRDETLATLLDTFSEEYAHADRPYRVARLRALCLSVLTHICRYHSRPTAEKNDLSDSFSRIREAIRFMESAFPKNITLDDVADYLHISKYYFAHEFKAITGTTFLSFLNNVRIQEAKKMLAEGALDVGEVSEACGFENRSHFAKIFKRYVGVLPKEYKRGNMPENRIP